MVELGYFMERVFWATVFGRSYFVLDRDGLHLLDIERDCCVYSVPANEGVVFEKEALRAWLEGLDWEALGKAVK